MQITPGLMPVDRLLALRNPIEILFNGGDAMQFHEVVRDVPLVQSARAR